MSCFFSLGQGVSPTVGGGHRPSLHLPHRGTRFAALTKPRTPVGGGSQRGKGVICVHVPLHKGFPSAAGSPTGLRPGTAAPPRRSRLDTASLFAADPLRSAVCFLCTSAALAQDAATGCQAGASVLRLQAKVMPSEGACFRHHTRSGRDVE